MTDNIDLDLIGTIRKETHFDPNQEAIVIGWSLWCLVKKRHFNVYQRSEEVFVVWRCIDSTCSGNIGYELARENLDVIAHGWEPVRAGVVIEGGVT
jgi:hypothetical protein